MKCLSLTAPYGTLIALAEKYPDLGKRIETRSWQTSYRGPLAIHQAQGLGPAGGKMGLFRLCSVDPFASALRLYHPMAPAYPEVWLPRGAIVAVCDLVDCVPTTYVRTVKIVRYGDREWLWTEHEKAFGDYADGRWAWLLANIRALPEPVPCKGHLGLWNYEGEL